MKYVLYVLSVAPITWTLPNALVADEIDEQFQTIASVAPGGHGSKAARAACDRLSRHGTKILPRLLAAMDTTNFVAANWYRTVYEQIIRRELKKKDPQLPLKSLRNYLRNPKRQGRVRRLVLDLLDRREPSFRKQILPTFLDDPEFRDDAVAAVFEKGDALKKKGDSEAAKRQFQKAFQHARDSGQITAAANRLKSLGKTVNIVQHMGFVIDWYLLGPFDAPGTTGFDRTFPPEKKVDLKAQYAGKGGTAIRWKRFQTDDRFGQSNLIRAIAPVKEAVGYAYTEFDAASDQRAQLRCGADDNLTVWLNGEKIFSRLQWLNGTRLDRFTAPARLKRGKNRLLVKICQGPQHKNPAVPNNWSLQLRFCDAQGTGIRLKSKLPPIEGEN